MRAIADVVIGSVVDGCVGTDDKVDGGTEGVWWVTSGVGVEVVSGRGY